nr:hypothetical protein [Tanacetum cinerariifolium]
KTNVSEGLSKPLTAQTLPQTAKQAVSNTNVLKPRMYRIDNRTTQTRAPQSPQTVRNTNPRVSTSTGVNHKTNVSKPQHRSNQFKDKVMPNNNQVKLKKTQVEEHPRIPSISNKIKSVTACNDSLNFRTLNVNAVCTTCEKCLVDYDQFACVTKMLNDVNARTKKPKFAPILGYGDLVQGNIMINKVYYVEGLNHNLFSVGQFCDADLEVAFRKSTCFVRDLQGNNLLTGNRRSDLYTISLQESTSSTPLYLMAKASPTQAWLWHRRLSYLNFDYINLLLKKDVVYTELDEVTNLQRDYLETLEKCECLEKEHSKSKMMSKSFEALQKHAINLELDLQQCKENIKYDKSFKENQSKEFLKERKQYFEIQDLKAQLKDKGIAISELKKLIEKMKEKSVETKFEKSSVIRQPNAFKSQRPSILEKPTISSDSLEKKDCSKSKTKMPMVVPISTIEPKRSVNQSIATPLRRIVTSESTNQKPRHTTRKLYEHLVKIIIFIVDSGCSKHMTGNIKLLTNFVEKFLGMMKFGNDQIASILGYGDLVQGTVIIKRVNYVEGLNHNLFSVGQFCDTDLEVAFRKSTCYIRDLKGNDLLTTTSSQAWLWHRRLSHLNFDTINLLSKNDIVIGLLKLKFVKDHLCSSYELGKAKRKSFQKRLPQALKDGYNFYTWTYVVPCGSKDETPEILIDFLRLVQRGLHAQVRTVQTDKGTEFLNKTLHAYFATEGIEHQTFVARTPEQNDVVERWNRYSTQSRAYRVFNKRTRVIVETIHVNFDELPQMASDHVSSDLVPQCPITALKHDSLSPGPQSQENVPQATRRVTTSNELDLLFSPMFDELLNESTQGVSKSSAVTTASAPNQCQQEKSQSVVTEKADILETIVKVDSRMMKLQ